MLVIITGETIKTRYCLL